MNIQLGVPVAPVGYPIPWAKVSKIGSSLADLETRSASDLSSGNLPIARMPTGGSWNLTSDVSLAGARLGVGIAPDCVLSVGKTSPSVDEVLFRVSANGVSKFRIEAEGDVYASHSISASGGFIGYSTSVFSGSTSVCTGFGNFGVGTPTTTAKCDIASDVLRLRTAKTPASSGAAGNQGDICFDDNYLYRCIATNIWIRFAKDPTWT